MSESELDNVRIVKIGRSNMSQAQAIFFHAYKDNPLIKILLKSEKRGYEQRLRGMIRENMLLHYAGSNFSLAIALDDRLVGAACVNRADEPEDFGSRWRWRLGMYSVCGIFATNRLTQFSRAKHQALRQVDHYWIMLIGLHPDFQNRGFGRKLVEAIHSECEHDSLFQGISVDCHKNQDKEFFESLDYARVSGMTIDEIDIDFMYHPRAGADNPFATPLEQN